jgi:hypothetical protein
MSDASASAEAAELAAWEAQQAQASDLEVEDVPPPHSPADDPADSAKPSRAEQFASRLLTYAHLVAMEPPEPLIDGVLYRDSLAVLFGAPGSYKTFVALDWALCVAAGLPWQARDVHRGGVLYVAGEGSAGMGPRVEAWVEGFGADPPDGRFLLFPEPVNLLDPAQVGDVAEWGAVHKPTLVVIDTLARSMVGGDENSARDMGVAIDGAERIRMASGGTVLLVHHTGKDGIDVRGSSALRGAANTMVKVENEGRIVRLVNQAPAGKQKDAVPFDTVSLRAETIHLARGGESVVLRAFEGPAQTAAAKRYIEAVRGALADDFAQTGASRKVLCEHTGLSESLVSRAANALLKLGAITNEGSKTRPIWKIVP